MKIDLAHRAGQDPGVGVDFSDPFLDEIDRIVIHEIHFVDQQDISVRQLVVSRLGPIQIAVKIRRVDECDHPVKSD